MKDNSRAAQAAENFDAALKKLEQALAWPENEATRDSALMRFMFTYELAWKLLKHFLREKLLIDASSPREVLRESFAQGLLGENEGVWIDMANERNVIVHTYDETQAKEIFLRVKTYVTHLRLLQAALSRKDRELSR